MPTLRVRIRLPVALLLDEGDYRTGGAGEVINLRAGPLEETGPRTILSLDFAWDDAVEAEQAQQVRIRAADQLLGRTNRLLRWYRSVLRRADVIELTRAQASPFEFEVIEGDPRPEWIAPIEHEESRPTPRAMTDAQLTAEVRTGLASGGEPEVDILFLLDAERALHQGRFREAVLFCWSTIDSVFNRKFDLLASAATRSEWSEARKFLTGMDFGLRHKMSLGMRFVAGRSLFEEEDHFWTRLSASYQKRNKIIHEGQTASEDDARQAIEVAKRLVAIMDEIPIP